MGLQDTFHVRCCLIDGSDETSDKIVDVVLSFVEVVVVEGVVEEYMN